MSYSCQSCNYVAANGPDLMTHTSMSHSNFFMATYTSQYYPQHLFPQQPLAVGGLNQEQQHIPSAPPTIQSPILFEKDPKSSQTIQNDSAKYDCESCGKRFRHKGNMQRHVNTIHKKCEEFSCHLCEYKTIHKHFLKNHVKRVHQRVKRFHCDQCDYKSYDSGNLERHCKMVHLQIKSRFSCEICDYKTFLAANLTRHVKAVHLRIKAYSCHLCDHKASTSQTLRIHINNKHNVDPVTHECIQCGKKFKAHHNLKRHAKSVHKIESCN